MTETTRPGSEGIERRYLIIGYPRSGTTVTHLLLKGHPQVAALTDELCVDPLFSRGVSTFTRGNDSALEKSRAPFALFDALASLEAEPDTQVLGAKIALGERGARQLVAAVQQQFPGLHIIIVRRRDLLAQYGSAQVGRRTGVMHSWSPGFAARRAVPKVKVNRHLFTRYALSCLGTYRCLEQLKRSHPVFEFELEALERDQDAVYRALLAFLALPYVEPSWLHSRKVMPPPEDYIVDYPALRAYAQTLEAQHAAGTVPATRRWLAAFWTAAYKHLNLAGRWRGRRRRRAIETRSALVKSK